jgi:beta-alanine--pyruvate transaminase
MAMAFRLSRPFSSSLSYNHNTTITRSLSTNISSNQGFWQPFTDHYRLKDKTKLFQRAEGVYYYTDDNRKIYDAIAGLWCSNAGHCQPKIVDAIQKQAATMDFAPSFNTTHALGPKFAQKLLDLLPNRNFREVFFTMCGSTAVDTAMKIALSYHRAKGNGERVRFIGRERGYHGVGFGGKDTNGLVSIFLCIYGFFFRYKCGWHHG